MQGSLPASFEKEITAIDYSSPVTKINGKYKREEREGGGGGGGGGGRGGGEKGGKKKGRKGGGRGRKGSWKGEWRVDDVLYRMIQLFSFLSNSTSTLPQLR